MGPDIWKENQKQNKNKQKICIEQQMRNLLPL